jgi:nucleotide-binding universal stress UspA family protein
MRRVLIVSPAFPPLSTPDLQRVRMSLPYYRQYGWDPVVLTVDPAEQEYPHEKELSLTIPADVRIETCSALPLRLSRLFGLKNVGLRSWGSLLLRGARIIRREKIDLVYFSTTQFVTFSLGRIWKRLFGVPYVIDLQDPWRTDYYEREGVRRPPGGWKYQLARLQARYLEAWSFKKMDGFISVSEQYIHDLTARYRWFGSIPSATIRFGASEEDLRIARQLPGSPAHESGATQPGCIRFVYTGAAGPITPHAVTVLFRAVRRFMDEEPELASRLRLEFIGTSYAVGPAAVQTIMPLAERAGVAKLVFEQPTRLGHLQSLREQGNADVLLLLGSTDLAYSPSKIYPYYLSGRPILSLVFRNSYLESILRELNCATLVVTDEPDATASAEEALGAYFRRAIGGGVAGLQRSSDLSAFRAEYTAEALTRKQAGIFDTAVARWTSNAGA